MNDSQIEALRQEQDRLRLQVDALGRRIEALASMWQLQEEATEPPPVAFAPREEATPAPPSPPPLALPTVPPPPPAPGESFELHLGQVWLVRIGIGMLLTGLIFLAGFAYQRFIDYVTPFERDAGLFTVSLALAGLGLWIEKLRETLRTYGRVLAAGGLAGGYYALYASHHIPALAWIGSGLVSNLLLMAWAGIIIGVACRRRSETLGVAAILLAYYTSLLGPDVTYTLTSNLILAGAASFLTLRYGWKFISYSALAGTYGIYAFSGIAHGHPASSSDMALVTGYWGVFALGVLWPRINSWEVAERITLLTLNNACYLLLGSLSLAGPFARTFPIFALSFGAALTAVAFLSRRLRPDDAVQESAFFVQGVLVATLGWLSDWHGPSGALILGVESALLLFAAQWRHGKPLRALANVVAGGAFFWAVWGCLDDNGWRGRGIPLLLAAVFAGEALFLGWTRKTGGRQAENAVYCAALAALLYVIWVWKQIPGVHQFWVLAVSGAVLYAFQFVRPTRLVNGLAALFWALAALALAVAYGQDKLVFWGNAAALAGLFVLEQAAVRRVPSDLLSRPEQILWLSFVFLGLWTFLGQAAADAEPDWSQTLVWAVIAGSFFTIGLACRERIARWWGLGILATALGRVLLVDVWQLDTLSRILTFLGLGAILLTLGFVYNRYQEAIKKWL